MLDTPVFAPHGKHLIAGEWIPGDMTFMSDPAPGSAHACPVGTLHSWMKEARDGPA